MKESTEAVGGKNTAAILQRLTRYWTYRWVRVFILHLYVVQVLWILQRVRERERNEGWRGRGIVCVCTLHTEAKKSNCLLNTSEVKGWLGMRGVVAHTAVISLQKDKWVSHQIAVNMSDLDHLQDNIVASWRSWLHDRLLLKWGWKYFGRRSAMHGFHYLVFRVLFCTRSYSI